MSWRLVSLAPAPPSLVEAWVAGIEGIEVAVPAERSAAAMAALLAEAEIVLADWSGQFALGAADIGRAPRLAFVQQPGAGYENVDVDALAAAGIPMANAGDANAASVAEWCLAGALAALRAIVWADGEVRQGRWPQLEMVARGNRDLAGRRVGVVGFGAIGSRVAQLFGALGCEVSYWTRRRRAPAEEHGARWRELDDLVASSDVLVVVLARAPETVGLLGADRLGRLPQGAVVVDAGRGGIVDLDALVTLLDAGALAGAAIDVFPTEPLPADSPLRAHERIVLSPHAAGTTAEAVGRLFDVVRDNVRRAVAGEPVRNVVNGVDPVVRRRAPA